jgi:hypothetical protein
MHLIYTHSIEGSWIYNYLCNQWVSTLKLWVQIPLGRSVLDTTLCDKKSLKIPKGYTVCQWLATSWWFSLCNPVSSTNITDRHNITEMLLKWFFFYILDVTHDNTSYTVTSNFDVLISTKIRVSKATSLKYILFSSRYILDTCI